MAMTQILFARHRRARRILQKPSLITFIHADPFSLRLFEPTYFVFKRTVDGFHILIAQYPADFKWVLMFTLLVRS